MWAFASSLESSILKAGEAFKAKGPELTLLVWCINSCWSSADVLRRVPSRQVHLICLCPGWPGPTSKPHLFVTEDSGDSFPLILSSSPKFRSRIPTQHFVWRATPQMHDIVSSAWGLNPSQDKVPPFLSGYVFSSFNGGHFLGLRDIGVKQNKSTG